MDTFIIDFSMTDGRVSLPGAGGVLIGGQAGPLIIGTNDNTDLDIISGGVINIGDVSNTNDQIQLNGSVGFQYTEVSSGTSVVLDATYYFVEITGSTIISVELPAASSARGRQYILANRRTQTDPSPMVDVVVINTAGGNHIDGETSHSVPRGAKITLISNGLNTWYIV